ncbi:MAG: hypothetical protein A2006_12815 [Ignavibacteria bacterium GWC2_35_8]|nr:MAG: hypothetical protein A2006_12815 [Ignavibacteria bacterium GWC2_35_8]
MAGKAALFLVVGFSLIFLAIGKNFGGLSTRAVDNLSDYYAETVAHDIAAAGANMASNRIYFDPTWTAGYNNLSYQNGILNVSVEILPPVIKNIRQITSTGTVKRLSNLGILEDVTSTVVVTLQPSKFSKFAYYSISEGGTIWWITGDTVWGPFHTQDYLRVSGNPVYWGKATTKRNIVKNPSSSKPKFYGGFEKGVNLPLPTDGLTPIENAADAGGHKFTGQDTVYMTFTVDSIKIKYTFNGSVTTYLTSSFAPNGVIFAKDAVVRLQGKVKGQYSVVASGSSGKGRIYLDDNITYDTDPRVDPTSEDMLGIIAKNEIYVTDNAVNNNSIDIHGSIYSESKGFGAENYSTRPVSGSINLLGGIIQNTRQAVGTFSGSTINHGFSKRYRYDERLMFSSPPMYPGTGSFEIVSWLE